MDKSTKDVTRLCYVSADKKIFVNENAPIFTPEKETKNEPKETINKKIVDFTNQDKYKEVERILDKINFDITQNYNDWLKIGFAFSHHFGENGRDFFHKVSANYPKYDYEECNKQFTICLNTNTGQTKINTFFDIVKNKGIDITLPKNEKHHTQSQTAPKHNTPLATHTQTATEHTTESPQEIAQNKLKNNYARIGTNYYLVLKGETPQTWNKETILDDFGKHFKTKQEILDSVPKYTGFAIAPDNINYKREINGKYNLYEPLASTPSEGNTTKIHDFLKHIFTDKYPLALDYLTILYRFPKQNLPIVCLVSEERSTGKSTFLHFLKEIFKFNCTILGNEDFNGKFNSHYATKNIICVDESFIEKSNNEIIERLKRLNTDTKIYNNMKGIDSKEIDFFGKFILCSNRETDFIKIDKKENRFWVNLVPKYTTEKPELLGEICQQIPAFLYELHHRKITHDKKTRLWFDTKLFETQANDKIKENSKSNLEQLFNIYVHEKCEIIGKNEFCRTLNEILADFEKSYKNEKISIIDLRNFLQNDKKLVPSNSTGYIYYIFENYKSFISEEGEEIESQKPKTEKRKGKFYTLKKQDF